MVFRIDWLIYVVGSGSHFFISVPFVSFPSYSFSGRRAEFKSRWKVSLHCLDLQQTSTQPNIVCWLMRLVSQPNKAPFWLFKIPDSDFIPIVFLICSKGKSTCIWFTLSYNELGPIVKDWVGKKNNSNSSLSHKPLK